MQIMPGTLYVVATPIGNLDDSSKNLSWVLGAVDRVLCEDTRHTKKLLNHLGLHGTNLSALHKFNEQGLAENIINTLLEGQTVALVSDAGTPLISDPGCRLVALAHASGVKVVPIVGPCAAVAALSAAGFPADKFYFAGFLPAKAASREKEITSLSDMCVPIVWYEAPHRLIETLKTFGSVLDQHRELVVARELTKLYETVKRQELLGWLSDLAADQVIARGEIVLILSPAPKQQVKEISAQARHIIEVLLSHHSVKQAVFIAMQLCDTPKRVLYDYALLYNKGRQQD